MAAKNVNRWLRFELQGLHVIENRCESKVSYPRTKQKGGIHN